MPLHRSLENTDLKEALRDELRILQLPDRDLHTRGLLRLMRQRWIEWNSAPPGPQSMLAPSEPAAPLEKIEVIPGISVPIDDEDQGAAPLSKRALHRLLRTLPVDDFPNAWESPENARSVIQAELATIEPLPSVI